MMNPDMVYRYPLWTVALLMLAVTCAGVVVLELLMRRVVPSRIRSMHNDATAAVFSVVGVTFAVLLAFIATAAWDGFNKARAASYAEAAQALDVEDVVAGVPAPDQALLRRALAGYLKTVISVEWPAQAAGKTVDLAAADLDMLNQMAVRMRPTTPSEINFHALLLQSLTRLRDARQDRMLAAHTSVPSVVWVVTVLGGALTVAFSSFLGVRNVGLHLAMSCVLAASGVLVLIMILALSHPFRGDFRVSTEPFEQVLARVRTATIAP